VRHQLHQAVVNGSVDAGILAQALVDREDWLPPTLPPALGGRYDRLMAAVQGEREDVLARMRRHPKAVATLFALLPGPWMLELFGALERHDERMLFHAVDSVPEAGVVGRLARARLGWMRAVSTMTRLLSRARVPVKGPSQ
jgi:hypothetical protein